MAGFNATYEPISCYSLVVDNIRLNEVKDDPTEAKRFGVEFLFEAK